MLCISAAYAVVRCLSARLSVTFVFYLETSKHILELFSPSGSVITMFQLLTVLRVSVPLELKMKHF